jgi:kynurenine formamidase
MIDCQIEVFLQTFDLMAKPDHLKKLEDTRILLDNDIPAIENVGGDMDEATGKRPTIAAFPLRWIKDDTSMIRVVGVERLDL